VHNGVYEYYSRAELIDTAAPALNIISRTDSENISLLSSVLFAAPTKSCLSSFIWSSVREALTSDCLFYCRDALLLVISNLSEIPPSLVTLSAPAVLLCHLPFRLTVSSAFFFSGFSFAVPLVCPLCEIGEFMMGVCPELVSKACPFLVIPSPFPQCCGPSFSNATNCPSISSPLDLCPTNAAAVLAKFFPFSSKVCQFSWKPWTSTTRYFKFH